MDVFEILRTANHPVFVCDERDQVIDLNPEAEQALGIHREEIIGRSFHAAAEFRDVFGNLVCTNGCGFHTMVQRGEPIQAFDLDLRSPAGESRRMRVSIVVVLGPQAGSYRMVYHLNPQESWTASESRRPRAAGRNGHGGEEPRLTRREREILSRLVEGDRSREISQELGIRPNTLRSHTQNILRKLGARSKVEAVSMVLRQNLL